MMPDTRPRVVFDETGQCNACSYHAGKSAIDWVDRKAEFLDLVKSKKSHSAYDCVVPFSGGKDSAAIAYRLKYELGLNPLLVTYGQMIWTDVGKHNFNQCAEHFDIHYERVNQSVSRKLCRRFLIERGHPKAHYDAGINAVPVNVARNNGIALVIYAEHGETEYGGLVLSDESRRTRNLEEVLEHCVGDDPRNWATDGLTEADLHPYIYPDDVKDITAVYWSYFFPWDIYENALLVRDKLNFRQANSYRLAVDAPWNWGQSNGSFEGFDSIDDAIDGLDFYLMYLKFGFGRATRMASRMINYGHLTYEQGRKYIERYDGDYPIQYLDEVLRYVDMTNGELDDVLEQHNEHLT